jgi:hypothetical protein
VKSQGGKAFSLSISPLAQEKNNKISKFLVYLNQTKAAAHSSFLLDDSFFFSEAPANEKGNSFNIWSPLAPSHETAT